MRQLAAAKDIAEPIALTSMHVFVLTTFTQNANISIANSASYRKENAPARRPVLGPAGRAHHAARSSAGSHSLKSRAAHMRRRRALWWQLAAAPITLPQAAKPSPRLVPDVVRSLDRQIDRWFHTLHDSYATQFRDARVPHTPAQRHGVPAMTIRP